MDEPCVNRNEPIKNTKTPTKKTAAMMTKYASSPTILKGSGRGGSGGPWGQDRSQSEQEHAGSLLYKQFIYLAQNEMNFQ